MVEILTSNLSTVQSKNLSLKLFHTNIKSNNIFPIRIQICAENNQLMMWYSGYLVEVGMGNSKGFVEQTISFVLNVTKMLSYIINWLLSVPCNRT